MSDIGEMYLEVASEGEAPDAVEPVIENPDDVVVESGTDELEVEETTDELDEVVDPDAGEIDTESPDWKAYADQKVPIIVDGQEQWVTVEEARLGFMRQQDYTRKTQQVADLERQAKWAEQVQWGIEHDPVGFIQGLAKSRNLDLGQLTQPADQQVDPWENIDPEFQPVVQELQSTKQQLAAIQSRLDSAEQARIVAEVQMEIKELQGEFGDSFDPRETLFLAAQHNLPLRRAHFIRMAEMGQLPVQQAKPDPAAEEAARAAAAKRASAKRTASSAAKGSSVRATGAPVDNDFNDIGELFALVAAEKGS